MASDVRLHALLGDSPADERQRLWDVYMQICRVHHQRQANHFHTGEHAQ